MPKISSLTTIASPAADDELPIVDTSVSTTKKILLSGLLAWLGSVWLPKNKYCFRVTQGSVQNIGDNSVVLANMDTEVYDYNGDFDTATYTYTAPVAGVYHFDGRVNHATASTTPVIAYTMVYVEGAEALRGSQSIAGTAAAFGWTVSGDILLAAGDEVTLRTYQDSAGTEVIAAAVSYFSGHLVHAV